VALLSGNQGGLQSRAEAGEPDRGEAPAGPTTMPLRGAAARVVANMEQSLFVGDTAAGQPHRPPPTRSRLVTGCAEPFPCVPASFTLPP
jgi:hypothetical protein